MRRPVYIQEKIARLLLFISVLLTLGVLSAIIFHIFYHGVSGLSWEFLTQTPRNMGRDGGVFPAIVGTVYVVLIAVLVAAPVGVFAAVHLAEYSRMGIWVGVIRYAVNTLAAIPSIVFGLFGFTFLVIYLKLGWSVLSGGLTLAMMILPTIMRTTEESIKTVPDAYREGSLALGATKWQTIRLVVLPNALPGILTGIILGIGRSVGETAAVLMTAGSSLQVPQSVFDPVRTLSLHLYLLAFEGISFEKAYATAAVLMIIVFVTNFLISFVIQKMLIKNTRESN
ncbi:phosphate ABC transporter, inner membrane subunit PstA [Desulfofarcimen acetoxidans DSM 771]|uniref:Phosphate transport system permease protein PstA n=1 Tax=Desulfofarcimen acetoxidans (strain ATCC 49208 / DSM 771 / KCTC 5769 / VKM B-1644 / 5575) TaxID=485916 RepID=C8W4B3_DESAS|nr:phosphate ABC transporter permease PstA [Desulfofarcimen acetoxidans]ACV61981.1 phosphate ABC transporter, inner membrane subunit PstA [Desulfofarcimen acetoxidans DSM 771]